MFKCDCCHTEYGGIRGVAAPICPRCSVAQGAPQAYEVPAASDSQPIRASRPIPASRLSPADWWMPGAPLSGEIAQLDRAFRASPALRS